MEDGLRRSECTYPVYSVVLILVVMEDGLRLKKQMEERERSLNPCCNGRWSPTIYHHFVMMLPRRLNPCCNGRWSPTKLFSTKEKLIEVLILVVMEDGLRQKTIMETRRDYVLILVVMEDGLRLTCLSSRALQMRLNPCCNGRWSPTYQARLREPSIMCLNPCCNGRWSPTENNWSYNALFTS